MAVKKKRQVRPPAEIGEVEERFLAPTLDTGVAEERNRVLRRIALDRIKPDFSQPRHVLPMDLYRSFERGEFDAQKALTELERRKKEGDLVASLTLSEIEQLAASIAREGIGLRHPINVYELADPSSPTGRTYRIGEGERRWWAHNLLALRGHEEARSIPALIETAPHAPLQVLARQQAENLARLRLPAAARARALGRVKEILQALFEETLQSSETPDALTAEQLGEIPRELRSKLDDYGLGSRVPTSNELDELVGEWMGMAGNPISGRMVRGYLAILNLPQEALQLAEAASMPEVTLRAIVSLPDPSLQIELTKQVVSRGLSARETQKAARGLLALCAGRATGLAREEKPDRAKKKNLTVAFGRRFVPLARRLAQMAPAEINDFAHEVATEKKYVEIYQAVLALERLIRAVREAARNSSS